MENREEIFGQEEQQGGQQQGAEHREAAERVEFEDVDVRGEMVEHKKLDLDDVEVKDRWSRYIGYMGIDSIQKQSEYKILIVNLNLTGLEFAKNIILTGIY